jgi:hypothetical protein
VDVGELNAGRPLLTNGSLAGPVTVGGTLIRIVVVFYRSSPTPATGDDR